MSKRLKYSVLKLKSYWRKKLFGNYAIGVIYNAKNGKIMAPMDDFMVGKKLGRKGEYDMDEVDSIKKNIKPNDNLYIIGTHWGTLLIPLSKHCKNVIGYEANPITFGFLKNNLLLNEVENAFVFNKAVGNSKKKMSFYQSKINSGGSKIKPKTDKLMYKYDNPDVIEVDMIHLDNHVKENELPKANGIIMDIEGAEYYALQSMKDTLINSNFLYIEYVPHHLDNVSKTSNEDFFDLIFPYFNAAKFMNDDSKHFDLNQQKDSFLNYVEELKIKGKADNILFTR